MIKLNFAKLPNGEFLFTTQVVKYTYKPYGGMNMKNNAVRWILLIFGILLIVAGIALFATPGMNSLVMAYVVCILMLVYGIAEIVFYIAQHKNHIVSGWVLADGIITAILGLLLLFIPGTQILTMSILFAIWVLFTGVTRTTAAFTAKDAGSSNWGWILAAGILGIILGIWFMCDPVLTIMTIGFLLPLAFVMQGVSAISVFFTTGGK